MHIIKNLYYYCKFFFFCRLDSKKRVSIVVPVFNGENYLCKTIPKILKQTYANIEIIFIDDGSRDRSYQILKQFQKTDPRIRVIQQANQGPGAARNTGLKHTTGDYILFYDSDDYLHRHAVKRLLSLMLKTNSQVVAGVASIQRNGKLFPLRSSFKQWNFHVNFHHDDKKARHYASSISVCTKLFSKDFFLQHQLRFMEGVCFEDSEFWAKAMFYIQRFTQCPYCVTSYRYNPDSFTRSQISVDKMMGSLFKISQSLDAFNQSHQSAFFDRYMYYLLLHASFAFTLRKIMFSSEPFPQLFKAQKFLERVPKEYLIDFYYDKNKRLALIFLALKQGNYEIAKQLYQSSYRRKIIKKLKKLPYHGNFDFYNQFYKAFLENV